MSSRKMDLSDVKLPLGRSRNPRIEEPPARGQMLSAPQEALPQVDEQSELDEVAEITQLSDPGPTTLTQRASQKSRFVGEGIIALRSHRKQTSQSLFNVSLDEPLKERLARASFETKVKQTVIVRAAINAFLKKEGY